MDGQRDTRWGGLPWVIVGIAVILLFLVAIAWALGGGDGAGGADLPEPDLVADLDSVDRVPPDESGSTPSLSGGGSADEDPPDLVASATGVTREARERRQPVFRNGETQWLYPSKDAQRADYGTEGAHCFVGETCRAIPAATGHVASLLGGGGTPGLGGIGSGGGIGGIASGLGSGATGGGSSGSGVSATGRAGRAVGDAISGAGTSARETARAAADRARAAIARRRAVRRARNDALRVPPGQPGAHCFTGEDCPALPVGSQAPAAPAPAPGPAPVGSGGQVVVTAPGAGGIAAAARTPACVDCLARLPAGTHVIVGPTCPLPAPGS